MSRREKEFCFKTNGNTMSRRERERERERETYRRSSLGLLEVL